MDEINEDPWGNNRNKRKFQDESLEIHVAAKHTCFCLERSSTQSNIQLDITRNSMSANDHSNSSSQASADAVMSVSDDSRNHLLHPHSTSSSSSSVNWNGTSFDRSDTKTCEVDISAYNAYACPSSEDCEFSSSECISKQSMEDLFCSNVVVANNSVLSSGRWNVNEDTEQGTKKLTIDKEFEQYFSMLML